MEPGIVVGDFILVNKAAYWFSPPMLGDVVVFVHPNEKMGQYVKRIVAGPGDRIRIKEDRIILNGKKVIVAAEKDPVLQDGYDYFREEMGSHVYAVRYNPNHFYRITKEELVLKDGQYFVMGDNRDKSYDSRFWGIITREAIVGKVRHVWFSWDYDQVNQQVIFRPSRILKKLN